jgi:hypothetical protein
MQGGLVDWKKVQEKVSKKIGNQAELSVFGEAR